MPSPSLPLGQRWQLVQGAKNASSPWASPGARHPGLAARRVRGCKSVNARNNRAVASAAEQWAKNPGPIWSGADRSPGRGQGLQALQLGFRSWDGGQKVKDQAHSAANRQPPAALRQHAAQGPQGQRFKFFANWLSSRASRWLARQRKDPMLFCGGAHLCINQTLSQKPAQDGGLSVGLTGNANSMGCHHQNNQPERKLLWRWHKFWAFDPI